jgi:hypothetical protein
MSTIPFIVREPVSTLGGTPFLLLLLTVRRVEQLWNQQNASETQRRTRETNRSNETGAVHSDSAEASTCSTLSGRLSERDVVSS